MQVQLRPRSLLHPRSFGVERTRFGTLTGMVQGIRRRGAIDHSPKRIAAPVCVNDGRGLGELEEYRNHLPAKIGARTS
jgi:hypothetical protein